MKMHRKRVLCAPEVPGAALEASLGLHPDLHRRVDLGLHLDHVLGLHRGLGPDLDQDLNLGAARGK